MNDQPILNKQDVAKILGMSPRTVDRLRKEGQLPSFRIGGKIVFQQRDVDAFIRHARKEAGLEE